MWCDGVRTAVDTPVSRAGWRRCCALAPPPRRHAARWLRLRNVGSATISACLFKVYRNESDPFEQFGDYDRFDIIEGGVLKIHRQDGTITYINPASWASIDDSPAPSVYGSPAHSSSGDVPPEEQPF